MSAEKFPRLSVTLQGPRSPHECVCCGELNPEEMWQECDDNDRPEPIFILLCRGCAKTLIKPHARLYESHDRNTPFPGMMGICDNCINREGYRCDQSIANGGPGLLIGIAAPQTAHLNFGGGRGAWVKLYPWEAHGCTRRIVDQDARDKDYGP